MKMCMVDIWIWEGMEKELSELFSADDTAVVTYAEVKLCCLMSKLNIVCDWRIGRVLDEHRK